MKLLRDSFWRRALRATRLPRRAPAYASYVITVPAPRRLPPGAATSSPTALAGTPAPTREPPNAGHP